MQKENRSRVVHIRLSESEVNRLKTLVQCAGKHEYFSSYIRRKILAEADRAEVAMAK